MLKGKTAIVTGAAKGIGRAIAAAFAKEGCNIVLNYHSSVSEETIKEIEGCGVACLPVQGDVSDFDFAASLIKQAKKEFGSVDILVNNAGITRDMLAARGITCNAIAPGFVETDMTAVLTDEQKEKMLEVIPLKRYGKTEDIASTAVFLAENTYITGQVINVDGGMVM